MPDRPAPTLAESLAATQGWWREAGVDLAFVDHPVRWLADDAPTDPPAESPASPLAPVRTEPAPAGIGGDRDRWPQSLAEFGDWWLSEPSLDTGGTHPRLAPRGIADAALLLLVPMPEEGDRDSLLEGPHGRLLASFARAADVPPECVAVAAALPRHTPLPDWDRLAAHGHGEVLRHFLGLAQPRRLIAFGRGILPLLGHAPAQGAPAVSELSIQGRRVPLLSTYAPERLLENARLRAGLWQRWLEWTDDGKA
jgi:hypothetical protein